MKLRSIYYAAMMLFTTQLYSSTNTSLQSLRIAFCSNQNSSTPTFNVNQDTMDQCVDFLTHYANIQKQRKLTLEEMTVVIEIVMYLFANSSNQHTQHIEILLNNKEKLLVPYSSQLFALITQQTTEKQ